MLGAVRGVAKQSLSWVPFAGSRKDLSYLPLGSVLQGMGFAFVSRNFDQDKKKLYTLLHSTYEKG
jgi:hypothetical protein